MSTRMTNPLNPNYRWRDSKELEVNPCYGAIEGVASRPFYLVKANKKPNLCLDIRDIEGTQVGSVFTRYRLIDVLMFVVRSESNLKILCVIKTLRERSYILRV